MMLPGQLGGHICNVRPLVCGRTAPSAHASGFTRATQRHQLPIGVRQHLSRPRRTLRLLVKSEALSNKGKRFDPSNVEVKRILGEGSYGAAYEGTLRSRRGFEKVVLKRIKTRVEGAEQMGQMEHLLNVHAASAARGAVAEFMGYLEVQPEEASTRLTQGLWLVWSYEGALTLGSYLRRRDCLRTMAADLEVPESLAVPTAMRHILECLQAIHKAGMVHRDVKPANIIFAEATRRFKLIDLGACADLRSGTNFIPDESILDPMYCPPEQYCLPTDAPHLAKENFLVTGVLSPLVWAQHRPDRFDSYSVGLVLMQLGLPKLRSSQALKHFSQQLADCQHDLDVWRSRHGPAAKDSPVLSTNNDSGWELARTLLQRRLVVADKVTGSVGFVRGGAQRISVTAALRHPFILQAEANRGVGWRGVFGGSAEKTLAMGGPRGGSAYVSAGSVRRAEAAAARAAAANNKQQVEPPPKRRGLGAALMDAILRPRHKRQEEIGLSGMVGSQKSAVKKAPQGGSDVRKAKAVGRAVGIWERASGKLFNLESRIQDQADATRKQTNVVKTLEARVRAGEAAPAELHQESDVLSSMTEQLTGMTSEFRSLYRGVLGGITGQKKRESTVPKNRPPTRVPAANSRTSLDDDEITTAPQATAESASVTAAASKAVVAGLRFTGQALGIANDMVASIEGQTAASNRARQDAIAAEAQAVSAANSALRPMEAAAPAAAATAAAAAAAAAADQAGAAARRPPVVIARGGSASSGGTRPANAGADSRSQARAFMEMMRDLSPSLSGRSRWGPTRERIRGDPRYKAVPPSQREKLFNTYLQAVQQLEVAAKERAARARAAFQELLEESDINAASTWEASQPLLKLSPTFAALPEAECRAAFDAAVAEKAHRAAAAVGGDLQFRQLLAQLQPPVMATSSWASVKRAAWTDARFDSVPEYRRLQLFEEYRSMLREEADEAAGAHSFGGRVRDVFAAPSSNHSRAPYDNGSSSSSSSSSSNPSAVAEERERLAARLAEIDAESQGVANTNGSSP